jgi:hypothetical protein
MVRIASALLVTVLAGTAVAQPGNVNDAYIFGDGSSQVYQVTLGGTEVINPRTGSHFALNSDTRFINPYRATWGGVNNNFYIGGFGGLTEIDGNTGAFVKQIGSGASLDVQVSYLGTTLYRGSGSGIDEHDIATGAYIRTLTAGTGAGGYSLMKSRGTDLYVTGWNGNNIVKVDQITGATTGVINAAPFAIQALEFDSLGNFYASALYEGGSTMGVWKYNLGPAPGRSSRSRPTPPPVALATPSAPTGSPSAVTATSTWPMPPVTSKSSTGRPAPTSAASGTSTTS